MTIRRTLALALALAVTLLAGAAFAQKSKKGEDSNTRRVLGVVQDTSENPVSHAIVQLKDTKTLQVRSFITQEDGTYHFAGLSTNVDYELKAEKDGMSSATKTLSVFDSRKQANLNLKLDKK